MLMQWRSVSVVHYWRPRGGGGVLSASGPGGGGGGGT